MALQWADIASTDKYLNADEATKYAIQNKFIDTYVKTKEGFKPEFEDPVREKLFGTTKTGNPFVDTYKEVAPHVKEILSFTPRQTFDLTMGLGTAVAKTVNPIVEQPFERLNPESVTKAKTLIGLAGAAATGGVAFPAMFTADSAIAPTLEKYVTGQDIKGAEVIPDALKGVIHNIGNLLGTSKDEAPSIAKAATMSAPESFTPEQKRMYGETISAGLYLATMPSTIRKGLDFAGEKITPVIESAKEGVISTLQDVAKAGEQQAGLLKDRSSFIKYAQEKLNKTPEEATAIANELYKDIKTPSGSPAAVDTGMKQIFPGVERPGIVAEQAKIETKDLSKETISKEHSDIKSGKVEAPRAGQPIGKTVGIDAETGLPIIDRSQQVEAPIVQPGADLKGKTVPTKKEIQRVSNNILKNNPKISKTDAEAMARDVIHNRPHNAATTEKGGDIVTDPAQIQEIKNSIAEGENILKSGKNISGKKMSDGELDMVRRSIESAKVKIGMPISIEDKTIEPIKPTEQEQKILKKLKKSPEDIIAEYKKVHQEKSITGLWHWINNNYHGIENITESIAKQDPELIKGEAEKEERELQSFEKESADEGRKPYNGITERTISKATSQDLFDLVSMIHPTEKGYAVSRSAVLQELSSRGEQALKDIGWPTDLNTIYRNNYTGDESTLKEILSPDDFGKKKRGESAWNDVWSVMEHWKPAEGYNIEKEKFLKEKIAELKKHVSDKTYYDKKNLSKNIRTHEVELKELQKSKTDTKKDSALQKVSLKKNTYTKEDIQKYAEDNKEAIFADYKKKFGIRVHADEFAKYLVPVGYNNVPTNDYRSAYGALAREYFDRLIEESKGTGKEVFLLSGWQGSGKSTFAQGLDQNNTAAIFEVALRDFEKNKELIQTIIDKGLEPEIMLIIRTPEQAFVKGIMGRFHNSKSADYQRVVPIDSFIHFVKNIISTFKQIVEHFGDKVGYMILDNKGKGNAEKYLTLDDLNKIVYDYNDIEKELINYVRQDKDLTETQKKSFLNRTIQQGIVDESAMRPSVREGRGSNARKVIQEKRGTIDVGSEESKQPPKHIKERLLASPFRGSEGGTSNVRQVSTLREGSGRNQEESKQEVKPPKSVKSKNKSDISTPSGNAFSAVWNNEIPIEQGKEYYQAKSFEIPELIRLVREIMGKYPEVVRKTGKASGRFYADSKNPRIKLISELFKEGNEQELGIVIAHEFGHLTDWLPNESMKRGNIIGRLLSLQSFLKHTFGELNNKELKTELIAVTKYMHPYEQDKVPASYHAYRMSSKELYAEAISLLLNSPGTMEKMAPKFTKAFFDNLDKKLDVKAAYFDMLELLNGERADVLDELDKDIRRMFAKSDPLRKQKMTEKKIAKVSTFERLRQLVDNRYAPILKKVENLEKLGASISADKNPKYILEEYAMANNKIYDWVQKIDADVKSKLEESGLTETDLGVYTFLKRIIGNTTGEGVEAFDDTDKEQLMNMVDASTGKTFGEEFKDRKDMANPLGLNPARSKEQLEHMKNKVGAEKFARLEEIAQSFHDLVFSVVEEAVKVGSYNQKVFEERIKPNKDTYVSFGVINYMQGYVSAGVKKQMGTLSEIENPFLTTILKTISLIKLNEKQRMLNSVRDLLKENFADEIKDSKRIQRDGLTVFPKTFGVGQLTLLEDGRMASYDVDPYIAKSLEHDPTDISSETGRIISTVFGNRIFRDLYITYNPGFAFAFNPIRDFKRTYKSLAALGKGVSIRQLLVEVAKAMPASYRRLRGITDERIQEMVDNRALDIPFDDFLPNGYTDRDGTYDAILQKYKLAKNPEEMSAIKKTILKPFVSFLEFMRFHGSAIESVTKIAGYNILKSKDVYPAERAYITRNYIGTPNFRNKGTVTDITNSIWMFSNIMKEGLKADLGLATGPKTRSGYWWATAKVELFPKLLMILASTGLFGLVLKKWFEKVPEYDKTNYIIIPLGEHKGKPVYARIPHDETGRLFAAMFWKVGNTLQGKPEQLQQIFAFGAGQLPNLAPGIQLLAGWRAYLSGQNPYDTFRGRNIISDTEWKAGGSASLKKMVQWTANQTGQLSFATYDREGNSTFETVMQTVPFINRLIKVSDFGVTEELKQIRKDVEQQKAEETIIKREEFKKGAQDFNNGIEPLRILKNISEKVYPGQKIDRQKFTLLQKGLAKQVLKNKEDDPHIDALIYASTNEEKKRILFNMRENMSLKDFAVKAKMLRNLRIFSNEVMSPKEWQMLLRP